MNDVTSLSNFDVQQQKELIAVDFALKYLIQPKPRGHLKYWIC